MRMKKIAVFSLVLLASCATKPPVKPTIKDTQIMQAPFDRVWTATVSTLAEMALPIESMDKGSGLITTRSVMLTGGWAAPKEIDRVAQKPSVFLGIWSAGKYTLRVFVRPNGKDSAKVKITTHIEAYEDYMTGKWYTCYSKGVIEKEIFDSIASKISPGSSVIRPLEIPLFCFTR
jgi:starvation-inducible outer membrane lipoprotein